MIDTEVPVRWEIAPPDHDEPASGFPVLENVETELLYHATPQMGVYSHHPQIAHSDGVFYASWSNHRWGEDGPGQRVLYCISHGGQEWSEPDECFPSLDEMKDPEANGRVLTANGWVPIDGRMYAIAEVHDNIGYTDTGGDTLSEERSDETPRRARQGHGRLACPVSANGEPGQIFWLVEDSPEPMAGFDQYPDAGTDEYADIAARINDWLARPVNQPAWEFNDWTCHFFATDGHKQCEPTIYRRPDGAVARLSRDLHGSQRLYASISEDGGQSWSTAVPTDIPDSPSKPFAGTLPDGRVYLIGNQVADAPGGRDPLTLALSDDGITFDRAYVVRHDAPQIRHPGLHKGPGFQYPSAVVADDALWVIYSIGKEDVGVSAVPLREKWSARGANLA